MMRVSSQAACLQQEYGVLVHQIDFLPLGADLNTAVTNNTPPTVSLANTVTSMSENTDTATRIAVADITVTDDGLDDVKSRIRAVSY